jgi:hypothetical protein
MTRQVVEPKTGVRVPQPPPRPRLAQRQKDIDLVSQDTEGRTKGLNEVTVPPHPGVQTTRRKPASTSMARRSLLASQTSTGLQQSTSDLEEPALTPFPLFPPLASSPTKIAATSSQQMLIDRGLAPSPQKEQYRSKKGFVK